MYNVDSHFWKSESKMSKKSLSCNFSANGKVGSVDVILGYPTKYMDTGGLSINCR